MTVRDLKNIDRDYVLGLLGLEQKPSLAGWLLPTIGLFGIGVAVGAAAGIILAPSAGTETRENLVNRLNKVGQGVSEYANNIVSTYGSTGGRSGGGSRSEEV